MFVIHTGPGSLRRETLSSPPNMTQDPVLDHTCPSSARGRTNKLQQTHQLNSLTAYKSSHNYTWYGYKKKFKMFQRNASSIIIWHQSNKSDSGNNWTSISDGGLIKTLTNTKINITVQKTPSRSNTVHTETSREAGPGGRPGLVLVPELSKPDPLGPTGNPLGPTGNPLGPTGNPLPPSGDPLGPSGDPLGPNGWSPFLIGL